MKTKILSIVFAALILVIIINEKFYANNTSVEIIDWVNSKVLKKEKIQTFLNENYVPVLVLDQINGKSNPDLSRFRFPGFPTIYIYNKKGNMVKNISTLNADEMLVFLKEYAQVSNKDNGINESIKLTDNDNGNK